MIELQETDHSEEENPGTEPRLERFALIDSLPKSTGRRIEYEELPRAEPEDLSFASSFPEAQPRNDEAETDEQGHQENLQHAQALLYLSHFFAQFSEGSWQFTLILFLAAVSDYQSLFLVSTYGMTSFAAVCLGGPRVGRFVDRANRLFAAQRFIWFENLGVILASLLCYFLLRHVQTTQMLQGSEFTATVVNTTVDNVSLSSSSSSSWRDEYLHGVPVDVLSILLLIGIHIFGSLAQILDHGFLVAIERDWIVVMSTQCRPSQAKEWLSQTNVTLKQIDLSCKIVTPAVAGWVVGATADLTKAALLVGILNVGSLVVEYVCTAHIYQLVPALTSRTLATVGQTVDCEELGKHVPEQTRKEINAPRNLCLMPYGLGIYVKQPIAWGGFGLALLYLNALTFGGIMTAFLVYKGISVETTGIWRGISSAIGLMGTFVYHASVQRRTLVQTGQWSITYLFGCLSLCFASFFVEDHTISMTMLLLGACCSRIGLWVFDITITQLMQEFVPDGIRGTVGGTQQSLNAFFQLLSFSLGLIFPDPGQFYIFCGAGYFSIGLAMLLYTLGISAHATTFRMPNEQ